MLSTPSGMPPSSLVTTAGGPSSTLQITVPNSAGYGDPYERDPALVRGDVLDGFTTLELAERDYGVVIDPKSMELDLEATQRLREKRAPVPA